MSGTSRYKIVSYVTSKALNSIHLSECACRYGSEKNTKTLDGEVLDNLNKKIETGRSSLFVHACFRLGCGQTKLSKLNVRSMKKENKPIICKEEPVDPPPPHDIPGATPIYSFLQVNAIEVPDE